MANKKCHLDKMIKGFTAGAFDLLHAGHYLMFKEAKDQCDHLTVFLQSDPSIDRPEKNKPVESVEERQIMEALNKLPKIEEPLPEIKKTK